MNEKWFIGDEYWRARDDWMVTYDKWLKVYLFTYPQLGREESLLKEWLDCCVTDGGVLVATMKTRRRHGHVRQMTDEWLDYYRRLAHNSGNSGQPRSPPRTPTLSSDGESDDEWAKPTLAQFSRKLLRENLH